MPDNKKLYQWYIQINFGLKKKLKIILILFLVYCQVKGQDFVAEKLKSSMIWDDVTLLPDTVPLRQSFPVSVGFRKQFILSETPPLAELHIFADARYLLWINGEYVARGPNRFDPKRVEYDTHIITRFLKKGKNTLAILVQGGLSNYRFIYHKPGLGVLMEAKDKTGQVLTRITTDTTWCSNPSTRFGPPVVMLSGITDRIDEHREMGNWLNSEFDDSAWKTAVQTDGRLWGEFVKRMIPLLSETGIEGGQILKIIRGGNVNETKHRIEELMPLELTAPATVLIDIGQMVRAWFELDFETESVSHLELHPEQSFDGRSAGFLGSCSYKTTSSPGQRSYITTDDYTCRLVYLKLNEGKIKIHGLKVVERCYPFDRIGSFRCNDDFLNQLWNMSMRTSEVNATDGYIDGSEGGEWVTGQIDYPVTEVAFAGPDEDGKPVYSDMRLMGNQISRMALSQEGDELIKGWHPSDWHRGPRDRGQGIHNYIEDSSTSWVNLLRIYYDGTGDQDLVERLWPVLEKIIKWFLDRRTNRGLVNAREFYLHFDNPVAFHVCEGATLNAFVYGSLIDAAWLAEKLGKMDQGKKYSDAAIKLKSAYNKYLWDESSGTYYAGLKKGEKKLMTPWPNESYNTYYASIDQTREFFPPTVQAAVIALSRDIVPESRISSVRKYLFDHHNEFVSPLSYLYAFEAFYKMNTDKADQVVINTMRKRWAVMVGRKMPGTLGEQFSDESYYCHDFGPIPAAFLASYVLGVRRDGPTGNKRIIIEPRLADLTEAEGVVVTRHGPVTVSWKRMTNGGLDFWFNIPEGVTASVSIPRLSDKPNLTVNGKKVTVAKLTNRFITVELGSGKHSGTITP
jgi:alpha-L-rhamnosidase